MTSTSRKYTLNTVPAVVTILRISNAQELLGLSRDIKHGMMTAPEIDIDMLGSLRLTDDGKSLVIDDISPNNITLTKTIAKIGDFAAWNQNKAVFFSKPTIGDRFDDADALEILSRPVFIQPAPGERNPGWAASIGIRNFS